MSRWIVCRTRPNHEAIAKKHVERQGHETYLPEYNDESRLKFLFPSYLFVVIDDTFFHLKSTRGISSILMTGDEPSTVENHIIGRIRKQERDGLVELPPPPKFKPGDPVIVRQGAMKNQIGLYQGMRDAERVQVLLHLLGADRVLLFPSLAIEAA